MEALTANVNIWTPVEGASYDLRFVDGGNSAVVVDTVVREYVTYHDAFTLERYGMGKQRFIAAVDAHDKWARTDRDINGNPL